MFSKGARGYTRYSLELFSTLDDPSCSITAC